MIIAHNNDYKTFKRLLDKSVLQIQNDADDRVDYYLNRGGINLEKDAYRHINNNAKGTIFENNIELISGQKFPDIVAYVNRNKAYGLEVKTTKANKWRSIGSSIFEGTRIDNIENIHLLFGRLSNPIQFKCRKYEECLYDVAITHSPRYLIDMNAKKHESIFAKVGVDYDTLRRLENPFRLIKKIFRKELKEGEDLWWIDNNNDNVLDLEVKLWSNLTYNEKHELRVLALSYFPILLSNNPKKYLRLSTWLVSRFGIVNHALRDTFTAGGQVEIQGEEFPKIFKHIFNDLDNIINNIEKIQTDDLNYYWKTKTPIKNKPFVWKQQCLLHCKRSLSNKQFNIIKQRLL